MLTIADGQAELWRYVHTPSTPGGSASLDLLVVTLTSTDGQTGMGFDFIAMGRDDLPLRAAKSQLERFLTGKNSITRSPCGAGL